MISMIFQRQLLRWDDPRIVALNPGTALPAEKITVVHRSDSSGTTENFTKYLLGASPKTWDLKTGTIVEWTVDTDSKAGEGSKGVAGLVKATVGAVTYVDLADAMAVGLQTARVMNSSKQLVAASAQSASSALVHAAVNDDLTYSTLGADLPDAYPITAPTWILVYKNQSDTAKAAALRSFLDYLLTDGQKLAQSLQFAALPRDLQEKAIAEVATIGPP